MEDQKKLKTFTKKFLLKIFLGVPFIITAKNPNTLYKTKNSF